MQVGTWFDEELKQNDCQVPPIISLSDTFKHARDGMPAVVAMAASCLHKVSTLVIGAQAIVSAGLHTGLAALLLAPPSDEPSAAT